MNPFEAYGAFQIYGSMFAAGLVGIVLIVVGFVILFWRDKVHTAKATGVYSNVSCIQTTCNGVVTYKVNSNTFTIQNQSGNITDGTKAKVMYEPKNPSNGIVPSHGRFLGIPLIFFGGIFMYGSVASYSAFSGASNNTKKTLTQVAGVSGFMQRV